ncbi:hypothetical protein [Aeromicrobium sp. UC242_57]|uniref:hypothetical protein n=1 Tax=Aeromicrobium sp. UC242_57 TaxID=3374624 RepID=UPI0037883F25
MGWTAAYAGVGAAVLVLAFLGWRTMGGDDPAVVPDVIGLSVADAKAAIRDAEMTARTEIVDAAGAPCGPGRQAVTRRRSIRSRRGGRCD